MDNLVDKKESASRPNKLQHLLETAKNENYTHLYINYENLEEIPREVLEISSIQEIFLKRNLLKSLPADLWKLPLLKTLYLPSNKLTSLPEELGKCVNLEVLNVDSNYLKSLPKSIGELRKLKSLQASDNELDHIPPEIGSVKSLETLGLMNNCIQFLPEELSKCSKLKTLLVDGNLIEVFPTNLLELSNLEYLSLGKNHIRHLPQDLNRLCSLKSLVLDSNADLTVIPASVFNIPHLQTLGLYRCGTSNNGLGEIFEEYMKTQGIKKIIGNVEPLFELCLRNAPDTENCKLLPKALQTLLQTPKGCCYYCQKKYYVNGYFELWDSFHTQEVALLKENLYYQIKNTNCYYIFSFCSYNCLMHLM